MPSVLMTLGRWIARLGAAMLMLFCLWAVAYVIGSYRFRTYTLPNGMIVKREYADWLLTHEYYDIYAPDGVTLRVPNVSTICFDDRYVYALGGAAGRRGHLRGHLQRPRQRTATIWTRIHVRSQRPLSAKRALQRILHAQSGAAEFSSVLQASFPSTLRMAKPQQSIAAKPRVAQLAVQGQLVSVT
jgi:hypothetical protein